MTTALLLAAALLLLGTTIATLVGAARIIDDRDAALVRAWRAEDELERAYRDSGAGS